MSRRRGAALAGGIVLAVLAVVTAVLVWPSSQSAKVRGRRQDGTSSSRPSRPSNLTPATPAPPGIKAPLRGLLDRSAAPSPGSPVIGWVVQTSWAALQPVRGQGIVEGNEIDKAVAAARARNAQGGSPLGLRLRIYAGVQAPAWAKSIGGEPVPVTAPQVADQASASGTVGRFWLPEFGAAYADLERLLAARYDDVPEVREVVISRCTTVFAEPFIRQRADPATRQALLDAGLTEELDRRCFAEEVDAHEVWQKTRSDLSANPYQSLERSGADLGVTEEALQYCRHQLGPRCVLANNSIREDKGGQYGDLYNKIHDMGPPITFQTASSRRVGDLGAALDRAASLGASSVELPDSYHAIGSGDVETVLGARGAKLAANASG